MPGISEAKLEAPGQAVAPSASHQIPSNQASERHTTPTPTHTPTHTHTRARARAQYARNTLAIAAGSTWPRCIWKGPAMKRPRFTAKKAFFLHATCPEETNTGIALPTVHNHSSFDSSCIPLERAFITAKVVGKGGDSGVGKPDPFSTSAAALGVTFAMATPRNRGLKQQKVS